MRLWAISDLHLSHPLNRRAFDAFPPHPDDWLILAGDVVDGTNRLDWCFEALNRKFRQVIWVPGNHELWATGRKTDVVRGGALYARLVEIARNHGVITPEDPYPVFPHSSGEVLIAPLFLLYDYSFRPRTVSADAVVDWARSAGNMCADEYFLRPDPYPDRASWCAQRCAVAAKRLARCPANLPKVLVNHYPLEERLAVLPRAPRFHALVRNTPDAGLAPAFQCVRGRLWAPSHPRNLLDRRRAISGSLSRLSHAMGPDARYRQLSARSHRRTPARRGVNAVKVEGVFRFPEIEAVRIYDAGRSEHQGREAAEAE